MYPSEYIQYLVHFHCDRDYFECHEVLEAYWKQADRGNKNSIWVGLILLAVSCYHHRRDNFNGAKKTIKKALEIFIREKNTLNNLGLNQILLITLIQKQLTMIEQGQSYQSFNLPLNSPLLIEQCMAACSQLGLSWSSSDIKNSKLVHRHKQRDRTSIIQERNRALQSKKSSE